MSSIVSRRPSSRNHWNEAFWMSIRLGRSSTCSRRENDLRARGEATFVVKEKASLGDVRNQRIQGVQECGRAERRRNPPGYRRTPLYRKRSPRPLAGRPGNHSAPPARRPEGRFGRSAGASERGPGPSTELVARGRARGRRRRRGRGRRGRRRGDGGGRPALVVVAVVAVLAAVPVVLTGRRRARAGPGRLGRLGLHDAELDAPGGELERRAEIGRASCR